MLEEKMIEMASATISPNVRNTSQLRKLSRVSQVVKIQPASPVALDVSLMYLPPLVYCC